MRTWRKRNPEEKGRESLRGTQGSRFQQIAGDLRIPPDPIHPQPISQDGVSATPFPLATTFHILPVTRLSPFCLTSSKCLSLRDFPGGSVVETLVCHCRGVRVGSPVWEVRFHMRMDRQKIKGKAERTWGHPECWSH